MDKLGISPGLLIVQILVFIFIYLTLNAWVYKPLVDMLAKRRKAIAQGLEDARAAVRDAISRLKDVSLSLMDPAYAASPSLAELDFDSMAALDLCMELEERTGIQLDLVDLGTNPSVDTIARFLVTKSTG